MDILHFGDLGDTSVISERSLGVNLVSDNFCYVASGTSPLYKIWKQSDYYLIMEILHFEDLGDTRVIWLQTQLFYFPENSKVSQGVSTYMKNLKEMGWIFFGFEC